MVNGYKAVQTGFRAVHGQVRWTYIYTIFETDDAYYVILLATRPSALKMVRPALEEIVLSFREVRPPPAPAER
jgi:hypothetical protein